MSNLNSHLCTINRCSKEVYDLKVKSNIEIKILDVLQWTCIDWTYIHGNNVQESFLAWLISKMYAGSGILRRRVNSFIGTLIEFKIEWCPLGRRKVRSICFKVKMNKKRTYRPLLAGKTEKHVWPISLRHLAEDV